MPNCVIAYDPCFSCAEKKCEICELDMHRKGVFQQSEGIANNATTTGKWISVDERLPEDDGFVLLCTSKGSIIKGHYEHKYGRWSGLNNRLNVTHWMPLPEPPKMKGGAE